MKEFQCICNLWSDSLENSPKLIRSYLGSQYFKKWFDEKNLHPRIVGHYDDINFASCQNIIQLYNYCNKTYNDFILECVFENLNEPYNTFCKCESTQRLLTPLFLFNYTDVWSVENDKILSIPINSSSPPPPANPNLSHIPNNSNFPNFLIAIIFIVLIVGFIFFIFKYRGNIKKTLRNNLNCKKIQNLRT